jgi:hypothetical protein
MNTKKLVEPDVVESRLEELFRPVRPSRKFIQKVRGRIRLGAPAVVVAERLNNAPRALIVIGGVLSVSLLIAAGVRALFYFMRKSSDQ